MNSSLPNRFTNALKLYFWRLAASGWLPGAWFRDELPAEPDRKASEGVINLEIVSHCWQYSNLLAYQLSSLIVDVPKQAKITMTVFYCDEDASTVELLEYFSAQVACSVTWNWQALSRPELFRRAIGRNRAALATDADWIWFTDCDVIFHGTCIDDICNALQCRTDALVYPKQELITPMLAESDPMLRRDSKPQVIGVSSDNFSVHKVNRATGPLQIVHGDVARAIGYCRKIGLYQTGADRWRKTYEDSAFRWLLGTDGEALDVNGSMRIRHVHKGRYRSGSWFSRVRAKVRTSQDY